MATPPVSTVGDVPADAPFLTCVWDFGDGLSQTIQNCDSASASDVPHVYTAIGQYLATLTVIDDDGGVASDTANVTVLQRNSAVVVMGATGVGPAGVDVELRLFDAHSDLATLSGRTLSIAFGGTTTTATTDAAGYVTVTLPFVPDAPNTVQASYAGEALYIGSQTSATFLPAPSGQIPSTEQIAAPDNAGKSFVLTLPENFDNIEGYSQVQVYMTSQVETVATVEVPGIGFGPHNYVVRPGQFTIADLPVEALLLGSGLIENKGILVTAPHELEVFGVSQENFTTDSYLALPEDVLGTDYWVASHTQVLAPSTLSVVSTVDGTQVTIVPTGDMLGGPSAPGLHPAGVPLTVTLDRLQVLRMESAAPPGGPSDDLTGTHITSTQPVSVISGTNCSVVGGSLACDVMTEMLPPSETFGQEFLAVPFAGPNGADQGHGAFIRVVAAADATTVTINGAVAAILDQGEFLQHDMLAGETAHVLTSEPAYAYQLMKSASALPQVNNSGDPALMMLVPTHQFGSKTTVPTISRRDSNLNDFISIIAPTASVGGVRLDGQPLVSPVWVPIGASGFSAVQAPLTPGGHEVRHVVPTTPLLVYSYGFVNYESYAQVGGMRVQAAGAGCSATATLPGDGIDNDCDGLTDEELGNGVDDDGDGVIDEDLAIGGVGVNLAPSVQDLAVGTDEDRPVQIVLPGFDPNGDFLTYTIVTPPMNGTLSLTGAVATYTPDADVFGPDSFTYEASDGTLSSAVATVNISVASVNDGPRLVSSVSSNTIQGTPYLVIFQAVDPDPGETFTWSVLDGPAGMTIDSTGRVNFTAGPDQVGRHSYTIQVTDSTGLTDTRTVLLIVSNVNDAPVFSAVAPLQALVAAPYRYVADVSDPDPGDLHLYTLDVGPPGLSVDGASGLVQWTPQAGDEGPHNVTLRATDGGGLFDTQSFTITVAADATPPNVSVSASPQRFDPGQSTLITVTATDAAPITGLTLTVDGAPLTLDANGQAVYTSNVSGTHAVVATATDGSGNVGNATTQVGVSDPADTTPPFVAIDTPAEFDTLTFLHDVFGTADDANLLFYELVLRRVDEPGGRIVGSGTSPVLSAQVGAVDATLLENGLYELRLAAEDVNGQRTEVAKAVRIEGGAKVGPVRLTFVDMVVPVAGIPIAVTRTYDSRDKSQGEFGYGWKLGASAGRIYHSDPVGEGFVVATLDQPFALPCAEIIDQDAHLTEVRLSARERYVFKPTLVNTFPLSGGCRGDMVFQLVEGTTQGAQLFILGPTGVRSLGALVNSVTDPLPKGILVDELTILPYNPRQFQLHLADGRVFDLDANLGVTGIQEPNGNFVSIQHGGIVHSSGKSVTFVRDAADRITRIIDPMGETVDYTYDAVGDLVDVTNQVQETTQFGYSSAVPHHLTEIIDPLGRRQTEFTYDADGRMVESCDVNGNCVDIQHDLAGQSQTQTDATGVSQSVVYDFRGNITSSTDGLGNTTLFQYDANDNLTRLEDPEGGVTTFTYDANSNLLSRVDPYEPGEDPADFTTLYTYDVGNRLTSLQLPSGATVFRDYDVNGNETAIRDDAGNTILDFGYDPAGNLTHETDRYGTTTHGYNGDPEPASSIDSFGRMSTMVYDAAGNLTSMTDETGPATFQYDGLGRDTFSDYGNGITSTQQYATGAPDWTVTDGPTTGRIERKFTASNRLGGWVGPNGDEVTFLYDAAGRLEEEVDPLGHSTITTYDAAGRPETVRDVTTGATTTTLRDDAGRPTSVTNALGDETTFTYFPGGQQKTMTNGRLFTWETFRTPTTTTVRDPFLRDTTTTRNAYGLPIRQDFPDGTFRLVEYDGETLLDESEDFPTRIVDEAGRERNLAYNGFGQLTSSTDLSGATWLYGHVDDELRQVTSPSGVLARDYTYDVLGDVTSVTYPNNTSRAVVFGADRNPQTVTLPQGTTLDFTYDAAGQELTRTSSLGESRSTTYRIDGAVIQTTDATGITTYQYDAADRFSGLVYPNGARVTYTRDLLGRVDSVAVQATAGATPDVTSYEFDEVGNVTAVIDPLGGRTEMDYDAVNRMTERRLPNGVVSTWTHDDRDRVLTLEHRDAGNQVIASVAYLRGATGEPFLITREDGSYVEIDYDTAWRIEEERFYDGASVLQETLTYAYDLDGNRTSRTTNAGTETLTYSNGFEHTSTTSPAGNQTYGYDAGGRLDSIQRPGLDVTMSYDSDDKLTQATVQGGPTVTYAYDATGRRTWVDDGSQALHHLTAPIQGGGLESPHGIADTTGTMQASFVYAGEHPLMRIDASGNAVYYLEDAMGSVLGLADDTGNEVARFEYDSFGLERSATGSQADPACRAPGRLQVPRTVAGGFDGALLRAGPELRPGDGTVHVTGSVRRGVRGAGELPSVYVGGEQSAGVSGSVGVVHAAQYLGCQRREHEPCEHRPNCVDQLLPGLCVRQGVWDSRRASRRGDREAGSGSRLRARRAAGRHAGRQVRGDTDG